MQILYFVRKRSFCLQKETLYKQRLNIFLFPNPAENIVSINNIYSDTDISLYDILGKQYELNRINNFENNSILISTSNLEMGIYFIRIQDINTGQLKTLRLIKQ